MGGTKQWTLQLMYDNYIYFSHPNNNATTSLNPGMKKKGANFRKIIRNFPFLYFIFRLPLAKQIFVDEIKLPFCLPSPLLRIKFSSGAKGSEKCRTLKAWMGGDKKIHFVLFARGIRLFMAVETRWGRWRDSMTRKSLRRRINRIFDELS